MHSPQLCLISGREILILLSLPQPHLSEPHLRYPPDSSTEPQKSSVVFSNSKFAPRDLRTLCQDNQSPSFQRSNKGGRKQGLMFSHRSSRRLNKPRLSARARCHHQTDTSCKSRILYKKKARKLAKRNQEIFDPIKKKNIYIKPRKYLKLRASKNQLPSAALARATLGLSQLLNSSSEPRTGSKS